MSRLTERLPLATEDVPKEVKNALERLAIAARGRADCVRFVSESTRLEWQELLRQWMLAKDIPLLVRSSGARGSEVEHDSGRRIVPCDNSPAAWACGLAIEGYTPTIAHVREWFERDEIPVALVLKRAERPSARFRCTLGRDSVNARGWKLCHVELVGMNKRTPLQQLPIAELESAFRRLMDPGNYFLLAKSLGGLGEVAEFVAGLRR